ncbi:helix-turn-helix transcriptional regulator [Halosquirtibacter laminarini]|uniref:Helix-turn-helix transcriptional regulator n=1 Tax=Halosquirtibacter laminarini TaxID=3374600 RepID=A0AC61NFH6_9BACT|nr:helix-turn-helix transcriptional regulator [Prolixibacteraceae bacterium]
MKNKRLEERRKKISKEVDLFVKHSFDFVDQIHQVLKEKGLEQKDLAKALGKSESEISKWMTGTHNFTFKTAAKIEAVLGVSILNISVEKGTEKDMIYIINKTQFPMIAEDKFSNYSKKMNTVINMDIQPVEQYLS